MEAPEQPKELIDLNALGGKIEARITRFKTLDEAEMANELTQVKKVFQESLNHQKQNQWLQGENQRLEAEKVELKSIIEDLRNPKRVANRKKAAAKKPAPKNSAKKTVKKAVKKK